MENETNFLCPVCGKPLNVEGKSLRCENKHCYDVARAGYVNLLPVQRKHSLDPGDNKEMIVSRTNVMGKGYYKPLIEAVKALLFGASAKCVLDAGCGVGTLCGEIGLRCSDTQTYGTDISKFAVEYAAKKYKRTKFAVASSMRLPFADGFFDTVLCAFAPVYAGEFSRVTKENGYLIRVTPAKEHLMKLKEILYETPRENEKDETRFDGYELVSEKKVTGFFTGDRQAMADLVKMTPYYYHTSEEDFKKLEKESEPLTVNTAFDVRVFRKQ